MNGLRRFVVQAVAVVIGAVILGLASPALAHGTVPIHRSRGFTCFSDRHLEAWAPYDVRSWYGGVETVYFRADLYRWDGSTWRLFNGNYPWLTGAANRSGLLPVIPGFSEKWYEMTPDGRTTSQPRNWFYFGNLSPGWYAVNFTYQWKSTGVRHSEWATHNGIAAVMCKIS